jgi:hypothetical protein
MTDVPEVGLFFDFAEARLLTLPPFPNIISIMMRVLICYYSSVCVNNNR